MPEGYDGEREGSFIRPMIMPGEAVNEPEDKPSVAEELEFEKGLNAIREAEHQAWAEGESIRIF